MEIYLVVALILVAIIVVYAIFAVSRRNKDKSARDTGVRATGIDKDKVNLLKDTKSDADRLLALDLGSDLVSEIQGKLASNKDLQLNDLLVEMLTPETDDNSEGKLTDESKGKSSESGRLKTIVFVGVNGVGKTTTLGKIAYQLAKDGSRVVLAAADTFRAAAGDQLEIWGKRANGGSSNAQVEVVRSDKEGADPASVAFEGARQAVQNGADYLLIDTAGRQQSNKNLMEELAKIKRSVEKNTPISDTYLVLDATVGSVALQQAREFNEVTEITGIILTKLDGSAKGGVIFQVVKELQKPVVYIGVGEGIEDLREFNAEEYVKGL